MKRSEGSNGNKFGRVSNEKEYGCLVSDGMRMAFVMLPEEPS
jgi:hypothetical protein